MKALVLGVGKSGKSANKLLKKLGYRTIILDDSKNYKYSKIRDRLLSGLSLVAVSPGVSLEHQIIKDAISRNIKIVGEFELGAYQLFGDTVAITGTNGKTTVTTLIYELMKSEYKKTFVGGNIGIPVSSFALKTDRFSKTVLEVSSFQLETIDKFKPNIAVILNITPDHLNRHKTMENYIKTKLSITKNQTDKDYLILNKDDELLMKQDFSIVKANIYYFSTKGECKGCYVRDDSIYFYDGKLRTFIMKVSDIYLKGKHNLSNVLSAVLVGILLDIAPSKIADIIHNFKGVTHRLEYVKEVNGVTFINDSKGTNISSTIVAMEAMTEPTTIILGGSDKGYEFDELFEKMPMLIKNVIVLGETKGKILSAAKKFKRSNVFTVSSIEEAVNVAYGLSGKGETVLLSPACASFDMFSNFEERGKVFSKLVRRLK